MFVYVLLLIVKGLCSIHFIDFFSESVNSYALMGSAFFRYLLVYLFINLNYYKFDSNN